MGELFLHSNDQIPSFAAYLQNQMRIRNVTAADLASKLGVSKSYITEVLKGRSKPFTLKRCKDAAEIMRMSEQDAKALTSLAAYERSNSELRPYVEKGLKKGASRHSSPVNEMEQYTVIPLLGSCPASAKNWREEEIEKSFYFPKHIVKGKRMYLLRADGDSMNKTGIEDGDLILVDADAQPSNGKVVIARIDDECTIKRFYISGKQITLIPESTNSIHQPITINASESDVSLRGVVESIYMKKIK